MPIPTEFIAIDEEGYPLSGELRIQDSELGSLLLSSLKIHPSGSLVSFFGETEVLVEAFDEPYVAQQVYFAHSMWTILLPYQTEMTFKLESLSVDEWDRFHGYAENGIPFVMSRKAQALFFEALEGFDDDSVTFQGKEYEIPAYWSENKKIEKPDHWNKVYHDEKNPGWNLGEAAPALVDMLPRLKLPRSRILVLGCGEGHDAAHFANDGHIVTAVDFSAEAIARAKALYSRFDNITWIESDLFKLPANFESSFDIIFEHTCFCAINPAKRSDLIKLWKRFLVKGGHLMGVFFTFEKRQGPPYGATEWEVRERLKKDYQFIFWGRWHQSVPNRQGKELFLYATRT
jgi:SAM-dependent methyltransferase